MTDVKINVVNYCTNEIVEADCVVDLIGEYIESTKGLLAKKINKKLHNDNVDLLMPEITKFMRENDAIAIVQNDGGGRLFNFIIDDEGVSRFPTFQKSIPESLNDRIEVVKKAIIKFSTTEPKYALPLFNRIRKSIINLNNIIIKRNAQQSQPKVQQQPAQQSQPKVQQQPAQQSQPKVQQQPAQQSQPKVQQQPAQQSIFDELSQLSADEKKILKGLKLSDRELATIKWWLVISPFRMVNDYYKTDRITNLAVVFGIFSLYTDKGFFEKVSDALK